MTKRTDRARSARGAARTAPFFLLYVRVVPRASRTRIVGWQEDERLAVRVNAPPEDGRANQALLDLLAEALRLPRRALSVVAGVSRREKSVRVQGLGEADARARLAGPSPSG